MTVNNLFTKLRNKGLQLLTGVGTEDFRLLVHGSTASIVSYNSVLIDKTHFRYTREFNQHTRFFLHQDPAGCITKIAALLNINLSDEQLSDVVKYSSLPEMKATYARIEEELGPKGRFLTHAGGVLPFLHKGDYVNSHLKSSQCPNAYVTYPTISG